MWLNWVIENVLCMDEMGDLLDSTNHMEDQI
jgi:hypothetical protein